MPLFEVTTVIDAYDTYTVEAASIEEAVTLVKNDAMRGLLADSPNTWREAGYGDRLHVIESRKLTES